MKCNFDMPVDALPQALLTSSASSGSSWHFCHTPRCSGCTGLHDCPGRLLFLTRGNGRRDQDPICSDSGCTGSFGLRRLESSWCCSVWEAVIRTRLLKIFQVKLTLLKLWTKELKLGKVRSLRRKSETGERMLSTSRSFIPVETHVSASALKHNSHPVPQHLNVPPVHVRVLALVMF